ncbi:hypothetical protein CPHO_10410 [Corynebacterium phocae]|uniref:Bacterial Ig-like domain-containing protein n=1 Tax=Corynebacterium phocae TaxID=161895 RepID=A0A1L7D543_9CORY|nr:Ig-like domain-containing protein [Corynebacterium phocae]APT93235.1 hypothetical protein CPHO_10410 [Corynebacterium phocae]KAA8721552.1 Ig-like domain repeat protein [Corynebacterium phocae]
MNKTLNRKALAATTVLALGSATLVAPQGTGFAPEAKAQLICASPSAPLGGASAQGTLTSAGQWKQNVVASTDRAEVFPGDTFIYRVQLGSTYSWTSFGRLAVNLPEGMSVVKTTNPYSDYCGFSDLTNSAYPEYQGDKTGVWSVASNTALVGNKEFRQVDFHIKVAEDATVPSTHSLGLGLQVGPTIGAKQSAENPNFGPTIRVNPRQASLELSGDRVISTSGEATIEARLNPAQAQGRVFFSIAGRDEEVPVDVVNGKAVWRTPSPDGQNFTVKARYVSTNGFGETDVQSLPVEVTATQTTVTLDHPARVEAESPAILSARLAPPNARGSITFTWTTHNGSKTQSRTVRPDELGNAAIEVEFPTQGVEKLSAQFIPDPDSPVAASPVRYSEINVGQVGGAQSKQSHVTLTAPTSGIPDSPLELQAQVTPSDARGQVEFYIGDTQLGTAPVINGQASQTWTPTATGNMAVKAKFVPESAHLPSESQATYVTITPERSVIQSLKVDSQATLFKPVRVTAVVQQADAEGVVRFYMGRNPSSDPQPSEDKADKTIIDVPVVDTVASTTSAVFAQTGESVPVYAVFIPKEGSKYARSEAKVAHSKVTVPQAKAPKSGAVSFDNISVSLESEDRVYRAGDQIQVRVHLENHESIMNGFTYVNEVGLYAPKGFEFISVGGTDVSGTVKAQESLVDKNNTRYTGFRLTKSNVPSNAFPDSGYRDFTVTYRVTDAAVTGTPSKFEVAVNLYGGGDASKEGEVTWVGKTIQAISNVAGSFAGDIWGKLIKSAGTGIGGFIKGRKRTNLGPRTAESMPVTVAGTSGTGNPNPPIDKIEEEPGSSDMPEWQQFLIAVVSSFAAIGLIAAALFSFIRNPDFIKQFNLPPLPKLPF